MIGHLIDDDELDALSLKKMVNAESNLAITSSNSLNDIEEWMQAGDVDFILLDINRPDATSMEKDLIEVRRYSNAPVVFITGDDAEGYRQRATEAGAEGVLEKNGLSLELIQQVILNIVARSNAKPNLLEKNAKPLPTVIDNEGHVAANKFSLALSYLETSLAKTEDINLSEESGQRRLGPIKRAAKSLKLYTDPNRDRGKSSPAPKILRELQNEAFALAAERDVRIAIQLSKSGLMKLPSPVIAQAGLQHLLDGVIQASRKGDTVSFVTTPSSSGVDISISSNQKIISDLDHIFTKRSPVYLKQYQAMQSLNLAALLLDLKPEDFKLLSQGSVQQVRITIKA